MVTLNVLNQVLLYVDLIEDDIVALESNTDILVEACENVGLQVRREKQNTR